MINRIELINKKNCKLITIQIDNKEISIIDTDIINNKNNAKVNKNEIELEFKEFIDRKINKININSNLTDKEKSIEINSIKNNENNIKNEIKKNIKKRRKEEIGKQNFLDMFDKIEKFILKEVKKYNNIEV